MTADEKPQEWFSVVITADPSAEAAVDTAFGILDANGTEIDTLGKTSAGEVKIIGYFDYEPDPAEIKRVIDDAFEIHELDAGLIRSLEFGVVEQTDWLAEWKKHWKPTVSGPFVITPPWESVEEGDKIVIVIDPSMAFGTGTHETTRLCLEFIGERFEPAMSFLDVGTGTGILSIAAAKLAGKYKSDEFLGCDTDADSVRIARENAELNNTSKIVFLDGPIDESTPVHDFVCANMTIDVISPILPLLLSKTRKTLILSGILVEQEAQIIADIENCGIYDCAIKREGEWIAVAIECRGKG